MKTIYMTGYKCQNLGDDLFFITVLNRYPDVHFIFEDMPSGFYARLFKGFKNIEVLPCIQDGIFKRIINRTCRCINGYWEGQYYTNYQKKHRLKVDAYLKIGGSIFIEPDKYLESVKKRFLAEKKYFGNIPFYYIGCNFGPYKSPLYLESAEYLIGNCDGICFRDSYSYNLFKKYSHARVAPDVLFGIEDVCKGEERLPGSLGISLINLSRRASLAKYYNDYIECLSSFLQSQHNNFKVIRLFSFCGPEGDGSAINDLIAVLSNTVKEKIEVVSYDGDYNLFLSKLSELEYLISTRFHAMLLGLVYGVKTIPIVYSKKITQVLHDLNCDIPAVKMEELTTDALINALLIARTFELGEMKKGSCIQFEDIDKFFDNLFKH